MAGQATRVSMTEGPLLGVLLRVALPITITNLVQSSFDIINAFWVGRLGEASIGAVAAAPSLFGVLIALGSGLSTAGAVLIAQNAGAKRFEILDHVAAQTLLMVGIVALVFTTIGASLAPAALRLIGVEPAIHDLAISYLHVRFIGMIPMFLFMSIQAMLQSVGEVRFAMRVQMGSIVANTLLDPILIFGFGPLPPLGVAGAALATVLVQIGGLLIVLHNVLTGHSTLHLRGRHFKPDWRHIRMAVGLGVPASIEQAIRTFSSLLLLALAASFGTLGLAAYGVGARPLFFWFTPMIGLSIATAAVVGQNIGAGQTARAEEAAKLAAWVAFLGFTVIGLVHLPFVPWMMGLLAPGQPQIIAAASTFGYIYFPFLGILAAPQALLGAFRGAGSTRHSMTISIAMQWLFQMPAGYFLALATPAGLLGVWWSYPIANMGALILCLYWYRYGSWRRRLIADPAQGSPDSVRYRKK